jgi:hypothetical protein
LINHHILKIKKEKKRRKMLSRRISLTNLNFLASQRFWMKESFSRILLPKKHCVLFSTQSNPSEGPSQRGISYYASLVEKDLPQNADLKDILSAVWSNPVITNVCPGLVIRLTSLRGEVSKWIWKNRGRNPDDIQILAVGTTKTPIHLPKYSGFLENFYSNSSSLAITRREKGLFFSLFYRGKTKFFFSLFSLTNDFL